MRKHVLLEKVKISFQLDKVLNFEVNSNNCLFSLVNLVIKETFNKKQSKKQLCFPHLLCTPMEKEYLTVVFMELNQVKVL